MAKTPDIIGPADLTKTVLQRAGQRDCVIASVATALQLTYEKVAEMFEVRLGDNGVPRVGDGIDLLDTLGVVFREGWSACPLIAAEHPAVNNAEIKHLSSNEIKNVLEGHRAVVGYLDADPDTGPHVLAWDGGKAIDCSNGTIVSLENVTIDLAVVLTRAAPMAPNTRLLYLWSIHDDLMKKKKEVEFLRKLVQRKEEELKARISYARQRTKEFRKAPRHQTRTTA